jgi:hypothetical protein
MVADCCHSGTLLDQPEVQISGPKDDDPAAPPQLVDTFTAAAGDNRDVGCRALPTDSLVAALGEKLGVTVTPSQVGKSGFAFLLCGGRAVFVRRLGPYARCVLNSLAVTAGTALRQQGLCVGQAAEMWAAGRCQLTPWLRHSGRSWE